MANLIRDYPAFVAELYGIDKDLLKVNTLIYKLKATDSFKTLEHYSKLFGFVGGIISASSNILFVMVLLSINGSLRPSLKMLLSLAVSDFVQAFLYIMMRYVDIETFWFTSSLESNPASPVLYVVKRLLSDLYFLSELTGHVILVVMAADIFLAVQNPLHYQSYMSKHRGNILIICIWICCYLLVAISTLSVELVIRTTKLGQRIYGYTGPAYHIVYTVARDLNSLFFLAIMCIYIAIVIQVNKQPFKSLSVAKNIKMAFVLGIIALCYMFCSCSFGTTYLAYGELSVFQIHLHYYMKKIQFVGNSFRGFLNSIIYTARIPEVQRQIKKLWKKRVVNRSSKRSMVTYNGTAAKSVSNSERRK